MSIRPYKNIQPNLGKRVFIDDSAIVIGDVKLADDVSVWPTVVIRGDVNFITIGESTNIQDGSVLHVTHGSKNYNPEGFSLTIGNNVTIGHKAVLHGCKIGNNCLIGMGAIVLDGATIEDFAMVGAGRLIAPGKHVKSHELWVGSPARKARDLKAEEIEFLHYSAEHYVRLKNDYL